MSADDAQSASRQPARDRRIDRLVAPRRGQRSRADWPGEPAAIYCRISHARDEDQTGVDRQERICREIAERLRLIVSDTLVFVDNNRSAWKRNRKRPGWDALLDATREGKVRHVLTYHPDRLMRQPRDLEELLQIADDQDITLHGQANQRDLANPDDRFFLRIEVAHACRSSDDTSRRLTDMMADRARDGLPHGGKRRYGYAKDQTTVVKHEATIVSEVFTSYLDGKTPAEIARDLNERKEPTALGAEWNGHSVRDLLDSRHVAGIRVFRGEEVGDGEWSPIISRGVWDEAQQRRTLRAAQAAEKGKPSRFYTLRGLVTCKACGSGMAGSGGSYVCNREQRRDSKQCSRRVAALTLEKFVGDAAVNLLINLDVSGQQASTAVSEADEAAIAADRSELAELKDMWDSQELKTPEYRAMRKVVEKRISDAQRKTTVRPAVEVLRDLVGPNAPKAWAELEKTQNYARMNAVLRFLFSAVIIEESSTRGRRFDYGRVDIEPNPLG